MRGDCSIRIDSLGFTTEEIADCAQKQGLLSLEIELCSTDACTCTACQISPQRALSQLELLSLIDQAKSLGAKRVILVDDAYPHVNWLIKEVRDRELEIELFAGNTAMTLETAQFLFENGVNISVDQSAGSTQAPTALSLLAQAGYGSIEYPRLSVRIFAHSTNISEIPTIWRTIRSMGFEPHLQTIKPDPSTREISPDRARLMFEQLGEIDRVEFNRKWLLPPALTGRSCNRHLFAVHAGACGTIYACMGVTAPLGTIRTESLRDIITLSEVLEDIRDFETRVKEPLPNLQQNRRLLWLPGVCISTHR